MVITYALWNIYLKKHLFIDLDSPELQKTDPVFCRLAQQLQKQQGTRRL